ncbi:MAG: hypothetical protein ACE1ZC_00170, partial [Nitrososphaerales archaeon]
MVTERTSRLSEFYKLSNKKRLEFVREFANLTDQEISSLQNFGLDMGDAERMSENVVGGFSVPIGIGANFLINKKDYLIPMATEESSVIAAASNGAKTPWFTSSKKPACSHTAREISSTSMRSTSGCRETAPALV